MSSVKLTKWVWIPFLMGVAMSCGDGSDLNSTTCTLSNSSVNTGGTVNLGDPAQGGDGAGQSFQLSEALSISYVDLSLQRVSTASGTITVRIEGDSGGNPNGTLVDSDATASRFVNQLQTDAFRDYRFTFPSSFSLAKDTSYWIRVEVTYSPSSTVYVNWAGTDTNPIANGQAKYKTSTGNTWDDTLIGTNVDMNFRLNCSNATFN